MSATGRHVLRLSGYAPALPTPFDDSGELDLPALERLCHRQVESGATALVVCGTTGEASTLSRAEHASVVRAAVRASHGRIPVIAGAGSNSTSQAIELSRDAEAPAPMPSCRWCPTTTSRPRRGCTRIFARSPSRPASRSSFTTSPRAPYAAWRTTPSRGWRNFRNSSGSRTPAEISRVRCACGHWWGRSSDCCRPTMRRRWPSLRKAGTAVFPSPRTWCRAFAAQCIWRRCGAKSHRRSSSQWRSRG